MCDSNLTQGSTAAPSAHIQVPVVCTTARAALRSHRGMQIIVFTQRSTITALGASQGTFSTAAQRPPTVWPVCSSSRRVPTKLAPRMVKKLSSPVLRMGRRPKAIFDGPSHFTKLQPGELKTSPCNGYVTVIYNLHMILLPFLGAEPCFL